MTEQQERREDRRLVSTVERVTVYRDRLQLPYAEMLHQLALRSSTYAIFNIEALVFDASTRGLSVSFEGQQLRARNLLRGGECYLLELELMMSSMPPGVAPFLRLDADRQYLLIRATCRWVQVNEGRSKAGFELLDSNPTEVERFLRARFGAGPTTPGETSR